MADKFQQAIARFDAANGEDPNRESYQGKDHPKELLYARRLSAWLERLAPDASEALRLAARCQHIRRWEIPRDRYPIGGEEGRKGYQQWRAALMQFHAETAGGILRDVGYDDATIARVQGMLRKENLKSDPETQTLEDAVCMVFLENHFADFSRRDDIDEEKLNRIIRQTWHKMSRPGQQAALALDLPADARALLEKALA